MRYLNSNNRFLNIIALIIFTFISFLFISSCMEEPNLPINHKSTIEPQNQKIILSKDNPLIQAVISVQNKITAQLMKNSEIIGTATGLTEDETNPAILVLLKDSKKSNRELGIPNDVDGIPVRVIVTGEIRAMAGHTSKQTAPIQLGTSGGWGYDLANGYCCGGTLGSLITDGNKKYILSNYHVLYADIKKGGNNRKAVKGDPVIHPGLIDVGCNINQAIVVAKLIAPNKGASLPAGNVDAGIAVIVSGQVKSNGSILEIGTISESTVAAFIGQAVKKSGRTTGLTFSEVKALNATVNVAYDNECAGGEAFVKQFTGQILIKNKSNNFLDSGDSGSLMVEDVANNPRAVGLLFAGSSTIAVANPIDDVLSFFGPTFKMVGK